MRWTYNVVRKKSQVYNHSIIRNYNLSHHHETSKDPQDHSFLIWWVYQEFNQVNLAWSLTGWVIQVKSSWDIGNRAHENVFVAMQKSMRTIFHFLFLETFVGSQCMIRSIHCLWDPLFPLYKSFGVLKPTTLYKNWERSFLLLPAPCINLLIFVYLHT